MVWTHSACPSLKSRDNSWQKLERNKTINITTSFSLVTNISSWRAKSTLFNLVSLTDTIKFVLDSNDILEPHDQEIGELYVALERRTTDDKAPNLWKGRSGRTVEQTGNNESKFRYIFYKNPPSNGKTFFAWLLIEFMPVFSRCHYVAKPNPKVCWARFSMGHVII